MTKKAIGTKINQFQIIIYKADNIFKNVLVHMFWFKDKLRILLS